METYALADIIDLQQLQSLVHSLHAMNGIPVGIVDNLGNVLMETGWQAICTDFHRKHPDSLKSCLKSCPLLTDSSDRRCSENICPLGMRSFAIPVIIENTTLATLFISQFFYDDEEPDQESFRKQARRFRYDESAYLKALSRVPRFSRQLISHAVNYYQGLVDIMSKKGLTNLRLQREIAERTRAEELLAEKIRFIQAMYDALNVPLFYKDTDNIYREVNRAMEVFLGLSREEIIGKSICELFGSQSFRAAEEHDAILFASGKPSRYELEVPTRDGNIHAILNKAPILAEDGSPQGVVGIIFDISERIEAEKRLKEAEEKYRTIFENSPIGIFRTSLDGRILEANPYQARMLGYDSLEELAQQVKSSADLYADIRDRQTLLKEALATEGFVTSELRFIHREGHEIFVFVKIRAVRDTDGTPLFFEGMLEDITLRKADEQEVRRLRNLLGNIIDSMPSALIGVDDAGVITQWNTQAAALSGTPADEAFGRPFTEVFPRLADEMTRIRRAIREREPSRRAKVRWNDGRTDRFEDITVYPLVANGVEGAVLRIDDVTERVRFEEMMIQSEKMSSVGSLAAGMAHEINNPLGGILQGVQNVIRRISEDMPANEAVAGEIGISLKDIRSYLERRQVFPMLDGIRESGARAAHIVANLLDFSRQSALIPQNCDLCRIIDTALMLASSDYDMKKKYDFRSIEIVLDHAPESPPVPCYPTEIEQVLLNILRNAAHAMHGQQDGSAPRITIRTRHDSTTAVIEIEDNGPGFDEETRRRIFDPFFTTKSPGEGTGLGLSVSYFLISELHGGELSVRSEPDRGTVFIIELPL